MERRRDGEFRAGAETGIAFAKKRIDETMTGAGTTANPKMRRSFFTLQSDRRAATIKGPTTASASGLR
jgi:hypothetical protein